MRSLIALAAILLTACRASDAPPDAAAIARDAATRPPADARAPDATLGHDDAALAGEDAALERDGATPAGEDAAPGRDDAAEGPVDGGALGRCAARPVSAPPLMPVAGELFLAHVGLSGLTLGESTVAVLPDGARLLIDVGNDAHARAVVDAIDQLIGDHRVDRVVLTHHHADHEDALTDLLDRLDIRQVVHRGLTDLTAAANDATMAALCDARGRAMQLELCTNGETRCAMDAWAVPATACPGLPLHDGALHLLAANGTARGLSLRPLASEDNNGENARSVVGYLAHGAFRYVFAGDLTGGGSDTDEAERFMVDTLGADLPAADVIHLSHHARDTSSSPAWLGHLLPADGRPRTAVAGISTAHVGSPHASVVRAVTPRLGAGGLFVTRVAAGGAASGVVDARGGTIRVLTLDGGARYRVQAVDASGAVVETREVDSALACAP